MSDGARRQKPSAVSILPATPHSSHHPSSGSAFGRSTFPRKGRRCAPPPLRHPHGAAPVSSSFQGGAERSEGADPGIHAGTPRQRGTAGEEHPAFFGGMSGFGDRVLKVRPRRSVSGNRTVPGIAGRAGCDPQSVVRRPQTVSRKPSFPAHPTIGMIGADFCLSGLWGVDHVWKHCRDCRCRHVGSPIDCGRLMVGHAFSADRRLLFHLVTNSLARNSRRSVS